ncbi:AmmeMemoRadiSam system radical SAM enzyme [Elusimicrobiota bacterium]
MPRKLPSKLEKGHHPARLWKPHPDKPGRVICGLSPRHCDIPEGGLGFCGVRRNQGGKLVSLNYGKLVRPTEEVIETEAVFHYAPGERTLSLGNIGCTMTCDFCQNWKTSQARLAEDKDIQESSPEELVDLASRLGIRVISWTYDDPVVWHEFVLDTARLARKRGMKNLYKSAFFISPEGVAELLEVMDVFSISLKSLDPDFYAKHTGGRLRPVLDAIEQVHGSGRHLEISNLLVTGRNDTLGESAKIARWMLDKLGPDVPLHYVRFHPDFRYTGVPRTSIPFMRKARLQARGMGLEHVYLGNVLDEEGTDTLCECGETLVRRMGLCTDSRLDPEGRCPNCGRGSGITLLPPMTDDHPRPAKAERPPYKHHRDHVWEEDKLSVHVETTDDSPVFFAHLDGEGRSLNGLREARGGRCMISRSHPRERLLRIFFKGEPPRILSLLDRAYYPL